MWVRTKWLRSNELKTIESGEQLKAKNLISPLRLSLFLPLQTRAWYSNGRISWYRSEVETREERMIQLLTIVVIVEGIVAVLFSIDVDPIRKVVRRINYAASSKISAVVGTLAGTMFVILGSSINSIMKIQGRSKEFGAVTPTDQILMKTHMLEASLMGYALLLGLLIDRLHYFVQRVDTLKREAKKFREPPTEEKVKSGSTKMKLLKDEIFELRQTLQKLSLDSETVEKQAKSAEANAKALEEQAQSFLIKYDHLEEENQKLHSEISELKNTSSNVHSKKDA